MYWYSRTDTDTLDDDKVGQYNVTCLNPLRDLSFYE